MNLYSIRVDLLYNFDILKKLLLGYNFKYKYACFDDLKEKCIEEIFFARF